LILVWWLLFSRVPWLERLLGVVLIVAAVFAMKPVVHPSLENGMMGNMVFVYVTPILTLALVVWAVVSRQLSTAGRRGALVAAVVLGCVPFTMIRTGGVDGDGRPDLHWRWTPSPEQRLLAQADDVAPPPSPTPAATPAVTAAPEKPTAVEPPAAAAPAPAPKPPANNVKTVANPMPDAPSTWPGFRGPQRDALVRGVQIESDWTKSPPVELWRRPIGPGWSSFAVRGDLAYTQEQRGEEEVVSSYNLTTGKLVWSHRDRVRFWESNAGAGPRATPSVSNGRVYTLGATGLLNALDARTGASLWSRDAKADTGAETPGWGFAGSPLVVDDLVVVAVSGRLAAYDAATGSPRWQAPAGGAGYSSPHLATIDDVPQILLLRGARTTSVSPKDGTVLWEHKGEPTVSMLQPALLPNGGILVATGDAMGGTGLHRLNVSHSASGWSVAEQWVSRGLKPYHNDIVVHKGHAFGFDGSILACIDVDQGERKWKGGRYGHGQLMLLPEQDLLLVLSEEGELALVKATPDQFTEVARFKAIEGKTWNHPAMAGDEVLVRNGEEMAAFRLSVVGRIGTDAPQR